MKKTFEVIGVVRRIKEHPNKGLTIVIRQWTHNRLEKPRFHRLAIWGKGAEAMEAQLETGARFHFWGDITETTKAGKSYTNYTITKWNRVPYPKKTLPSITQRRNERDLGTTTDRDLPSRRRYEGFTGGR